jgi:SAM-dependent methyltransferase
MNSPDTRAALEARVPELLHRVRKTGFFRADQIDVVEYLYFAEAMKPEGRWSVLAHAHMKPPSWLKPDLDPLGDEYASQQALLWRLVSGVGRKYEPEVDEKEAALKDVDPIRLPGFYIRRDAGAVLAASDHVIASGMILKHCGLKPGDHALEYGAGFGQTALALARLGVNVDTVDISDTFCGYVQAQADFFKVPLQAHKGRFGANPRGNQRYDLVFFYEAFHHCFDFQDVLQRLDGLLKPGGRVLLAGEPIVERPYAAVPYPWGLRLHSEVIAMVRRYHWFELGFSEDFLTQLFASAGFNLQRIDCEPSLFGRLYVAQRESEEVRLAGSHSILKDAQGWRAAESGGRWTGRAADLTVRQDAEEVSVDLANPLGGVQRLAVESGKECADVTLAPGESRSVVLRGDVGGRLRIRMKALSLGRLCRFLLRRDSRYLGILVKRIRVQRNS